MWRGLTLELSASPKVGSATDVSSAKVAGRNWYAATATSAALITAERKKPRLIALIPERSPGRGVTAKIPITAVITPIAGTTRGNTKPISPKADFPRINAATKVTA